MKCDLCGGRVIEQKTTYTLKVGERFIMIENVPAKLCQQCGETLYSPDVVERLQKTIWSNRDPEKTIETPVFDFVKTV